MQFLLEYECYVRYKPTFSTMETYTYLVVPVANLRVILRQIYSTNPPLSIYVRDVFAHDMTTLYKCINIISWEEESRNKVYACKSHGRNLFTPKYQTIIRRCLTLVTNYVGRDNENYIEKPACVGKLNNFFLEMTGVVIL